MRSITRVDTNDALSFFNKLSGELHIRLDEQPVPASPKLANLVALPTARITGVSMTFEVSENGTFRPLTEAESARVVIAEPRIRMCEYLEEQVVEHVAPNGISFTVADLCAAVTETARVSRASSEWFGGIDVHHVYFEGLRHDDDGVWAIVWGS